MVNTELLEKVDFIYTMLGALAKQSLVATGEAHLIEQQEVARLPLRRSPSPAAIGNEVLSNTGNDNSRDLLQIEAAKASPEPGKPNTQRQLIS